MGRAGFLKTDITELPLDTGPGLNPEVPKSIYIHTQLLSVL